MPPCRAAEDLSYQIYGVYLGIYRSPSPADLVPYQDLEGLISGTIIHDIKLKGILCYVRM